MMTKKGQGGYTLVELLVTISIGAIVTLAATTVLLMGFRLNRQSVDTVTRQNTAQVLLDSTEQMASQGDISAVRMDYQNWWIYGENGEEPIYRYDAEKRTIYAGNSPIMKNVLSSYLQYEEGLLTVSVETREGIFNSTVYCRMPIEASGISGSPETEDQLDKPPEEEIKNPDNSREIAGRKKLLAILLTQYRTNQNTPNPNGIILPYDGIATEQDYRNDYYSKWYIGIKNWNTEGWNKDTPWCACFVTWGVYEVMYADGGIYTTYTEPGAQLGAGQVANNRPSYAGVDSFLAHFRLKGDWKDGAFWVEDNETPYEPLPGDVVFFDWIINKERDPQHVGVVLGVEGDILYTIEGNVSGSEYDSEVGLRQYKLNDPRILGYGVLDWAEGTLPTP